MTKAGKANRAEKPDEENPEWTAADFKRARPASEVLPEIVAAYRRGPGRPKQALTKRLVSLRLSPHVLEHFRAGGEGWQTRIDQVLGEHVLRRDAAKPKRVVRR